jgi:superfamily II DNA or RNA helicase
MNSTLLAPSERDDGFPTPRQFQIDAHNALRQGFRDGHKNQIIMAPTGAGKTYLGLRICNEAIQKGKRAVFLCDRTTLINQTSAVADRYGMKEHGIIQANHWRRRPDELFQIASVQTIAKREFWPQMDVLVVDECFPGDTLIATPHGYREIRTLHSGGLIYNAMGVGRIDSVFSKPASSICKVRLSDGTKFECTPDHPIFTSLGWKPAGSLEVGSRLFRFQDVCGLYKTLHAKNGERLQRETDVSTGVKLQTATMLWEVLCEETEEPDALRRIAPENAENIEGNRSWAEGTWRQWYWSNKTTSHGGTSVRTPMADRGRYLHLEVLEAGLSASLQGGCGEQGTNDCNRTGWPEPWGVEASNAGSEKGCFASQPWVESVEVEERGGDELVYNLRVSGHPSYFAEGILVHNCHTTYKAWTEFAKATKATVIGLSATPFTTGLGKIFSNIVNATTMFDLTQIGVLVPMRVFSCSKPDMEGAETKGGEWTDKAAEERELKIVGDVVADWHRFGDNRKTIVFGATIKHCEELCRQFIESGVMSAVFTSDTTANERELLLKEYRKPDSHLKILISVEALAKGFDVPDVGCICDARPLRKSLSTAIQMWGRGLRSSPETGKKDCHLLDFSGNIVRFFEDFNDIYFNGLAKLDDGDKLDKKIRTQEEFEPKGCPRCSYKPFHKRCMSCGFEKVGKILSEAQPGHMQEIFIGTGSNKKKLADNAEHLWNQVCTYARYHSKPENQSGRAWHLFKQITGQEAQWQFSKAPTVDITKNVFNKIQQMNIAFRRGIGR